MTPRTLNTALPVSFAMVLASSNAIAHHPMGGETPDTLVNGLLSGLGHPVIAIDHLAFIVGVGLILGLGLTRGLAAPMALAGAAITGTVLVWLGLAVPFTDLIVAFSVLGVSATMVFKPRHETLITFGGAAAAFVHGQAYGGAIIGAEPTPLISYLLGFTLIQALIAGAAFILMRTLITRRADGDAPLMRTIGGAAIGTAGLASLVILV